MCAHAQRRKRVREGGGRRGGERGREYGIGYAQGEPALPGHSAPGVVARVAVAQQHADRVGGDGEEERREIVHLSVRERELRGRGTVNVSSELPPGSERLRLAGVPLTQRARASGAVKHAMSVRIRLSADRCPSCPSTARLSVLAAELDPEAALRPHLRRLAAAAAGEGEAEHGPEGHEAHSDHLRALPRGGAARGGLTFNQVRGQ